MQLMTLVGNTFLVGIRKYQNFPLFKKQFLVKINKDYFKKKNEENKDNCWYWQGTKNYAGYGYIRWSGINYAAHRMSYIIFNELISPEEIVRHTCNNPSCVNPKHLILGSYSDNSIDSVKAGNQRSQKLNEEAVKVIKWMLKYKIEKNLIKKLARLHKVTPATISSIKNGYSWAWVKIA